MEMGLVHCRRYDYDHIAIDFFSYQKGIFTIIAQWNFEYHKHGLITRSLTIAFA